MSEVQCRDSEERAEVGYWLSAVKAELFKLLGLDMRVTVLSQASFTVRDLSTRLFATVSVDDETLEGTPAEVARTVARRLGRKLE